MRETVLQLKHETLFCPFRTFCVVTRWFLNHDARQRRRSESELSVSASAGGSVSPHPTVAELVRASLLHCLLLVSPAGFAENYTAPAAADHVAVSIPAPGDGERAPSGRKRKGAVTSDVAGACLHLALPELWSHNKTHLTCEIHKI